MVFCFCLYKNPPLPPFDKGGGEGIEEKLDKTVIYFYVNTMRRTKIVATIGPSSSGETVIEAMLDKGMDVARLNFSHGTHKDHEEKIKLSTSTTNIIMEGIRRLDEWPRIKEVIPNDRVVPRLAPPEKRYTNIRFLDAEREILQLVDGGRNIRDIIHLSHLDEFETLRLLMAFVFARYIQVPEGRRWERQDEVEDAMELDTVVESFNRVFAQIGAYLAIHMSPMAVGDLMEKALETAESPVLEAVHFDGEGRLDARTLTANVAETRVEERTKVLGGGLNHLLSFLPFEASKHLAPEEKSALYRMVGELSDAAGAP